MTPNKPVTSRESSFVSQQGLLLRFFTIWTSQESAPSTAAVNEDLSEQVMFMKSHHEPHENTLE
ncbi:uncharacterized protein LOC111116981 isoform X2 [Crassostrea virginica]